MRFRTRASSPFASLLVLGWCMAGDLPVVYSANEGASREEGERRLWYLRLRDSALADEILR